MIYFEYSLTRRPMITLFKRKLKKYHILSVTVARKLYNNSILYSLQFEINIKYFFDYDLLD